jgi:hypothetical protein
MRDWDVTNEMQMSKACIIVSKKRRRNSTTSTGVARWVISSRAHSCAGAATGAGAADSAGAGAGGNGLSESSGGSVVSLCASAHSRTGLVAVFAGDCDRDWWVEWEEACGMLRFDIKPDPRGKQKGNSLLWIGNRRTHRILGTDAGFGQSIITRVKVLAIL